VDGIRVPETTVSMMIGGSKGFSAIAGSWKGSGVSATDFEVGEIVAALREWDGTSSATMGLTESLGISARISRFEGNSHRQIQAVSKPD
jgi:hypothetical protein